MWSLQRLTQQWQKKGIVWFSPWLIIGTALILVLAIGTVAATNTKLQKEQMTWHLKDTGDALIWTLEGSARFMDGGGMKHRFSSLFEEVAKQPAVIFLALVNEKGVIVAHSDSSRVGTSLHSPKDIAALDIQDSSAWRVTTVDGDRVFEVYKKFTPSRVHQRGGMPMGHMGMGWKMRNKNPKNDGAHYGSGHWGSYRMEEGMGNSRALPETYYVFVGLDYAPFEDFLALDLRNTLITAFAVTFVGFAGVISLFWAQSVRTSRQMLKDTKAIASNVITHLPIGLLTVNPEGKIILLNELIPPLLGMQKMHLAGQSIFDCPCLDWKAVIKRLDKGETVIEEEVNLHQSGDSWSPVRISAAKIRNEDDEHLGYLFILRDVGEVKALEEQVKRNERLSALGSLAAGVAHEVRNPLSSIKGFATYLAGKFAAADPAHDMATMMIQEVERLDRVVSELLEFSRPADVVRKPVRIVDLVDNVMALAASDAHMAGVSLCSLVPADLPSVALDAERLTQALLNLLLNAVQACEEGGNVEVSAELKPHQKESLWQLFIQVKDNGVGISEEDLNQVFTPYYTTKASGTGLGLSVTNQIIEKHGGAMQVKSEVGIGTQFSILLPVTLADEE